MLKKIKICNFLCLETNILCHSNELVPIPEMYSESFQTSKMEHFCKNS